MKFQIQKLIGFLLTIFVLFACSKTDNSFDEQYSVKKGLKIDGEKLAGVYINKAERFYSEIAKNSKYIKENLNTLTINWTSRRFYFNKNKERVLAVSYKNVLGERIRHSMVFIYDTLSNNFSKGYIVKYIPSEEYFKINKGLSDYSFFSGRVEIYNSTSLLRIDSVMNGVVTMNIFNLNEETLGKRFKGNSFVTSSFGDIDLETVNIYATNIDGFSTYYDVYCGLCGFRIFEHFNPYFDTLPPSCPSCDYCFTFSGCDQGGTGGAYPPSEGGGSVPAPVPSAPPEIKNSINDPCIRQAVSDLLETNKKLEGKLAEIIKKFDSSKSIKINILSDKIYYENGSPKPGQASNYKFIGNQFSADVTLGSEYLAGTSRESLAAILIHEFVHAYLRYTSNFLIEQPHNVIADKYVTPMAEYLKSTFDITLKDAYALAWSGLSDSKAWKDAPPEFQFKMSDGNTITKSEATYLPLPYKDINSEPTSKGHPICP